MQKQPKKKMYRVGFLPPYIYIFSVGRLTKAIGELNMENNLKYYAAHWEELDFEFRKKLACAVLGKIGEKYGKR